MSSTAVDSLPVAVDRTSSSRMLTSQSPSMLLVQRQMAQPRTRQRAAPPSPLKQRCDQLIRSKRSSSPGNLHTVRSNARSNASTATTEPMRNQKPNPTSRSQSALPQRIGLPPAEIHSFIQSSIDRASKRSKSVPRERKKKTPVMLVEEKLYVDPHPQVTAVTNKPLPPSQTIKPEPTTTPSPPLTELQIQELVRNAMHQHQARARRAILQRTDDLPTDHLGLCAAARECMQTARHAAQEVIRQHVAGRATSQVRTWVRTSMSLERTTARELMSTTVRQILQRQKQEQAVGSVASGGGSSPVTATNETVKSTSPHSSSSSEPRSPPSSPYPYRSAMLSHEEREEDDDTQEISEPGDDEDDDDDKLQETEEAATTTPEKPTYPLLKATRSKSPHLTNGRSMGFEDSHHSRAFVVQPERTLPKPLSPIQTQFSNDEEKAAPHEVSLLSPQEQVSMLSPVAEQAILSPTAPLSTRDQILSCQESPMTGPMERVPSPIKTRNKSPRRSARPPSPSKTPRMMVVEQPSPASLYSNLPPTPMKSSRVVATEPSPDSLYSMPFRVSPAAMVVRPESPRSKSPLSQSSTAVSEIVATAQRAIGEVPANSPSSYDPSNLVVGQAVEESRIEQVEPLLAVSDVREPAPVVETSSTPRRFFVQSSLSPSATDYSEETSTLHTAESPKQTVITEELIRTIAARKGKKISASELASMLSSQHKKEKSSAVPMTTTTTDPKHCCLFQMWDDLDFLMERDEDIDDDDDDEYYYDYDDIADSSTVDSFDSFQRHNHLLFSFSQQRKMEPEGKKRGWWS